MVVQLCGQCEDDQQLYKQYLLEHLMANLQSEWLCQHRR